MFDWFSFINKNLEKKSRHENDHCFIPFSISNELDVSELPVSNEVNIFQIFPRKTFYKNELPNGICHVIVMLWKRKYEHGMW